MEYVFGTSGTAEFIRVRGSMTAGVHEISTEFPDMVVTDKFILDTLIKDDGVYKWYTIHEHYKSVDRTKHVDEQFSNANNVMSITFVTLAENGSIDEVTAAEHSSLFSFWQNGVDYKLGNIVRYGEEDLYKCESAHRSQEGWEPDKPSALWKKIGDPTVEYPEWSRPIGAGDGYEYGAKVSHSGKHWHSEFHGENVWEPGTIGTETMWIEDD